MSRKTKLCILWLAVNLAVIWGNSLLPGHISGQISDWVKDLLFGSGGLPGISGSGLVRKAAHFLGFTSLGLALSLLRGSVAKSIWLALPLGIAAACVDEGIQRFVPGRCGCITDVAIDTAGVLCGIILYYTGKRICKNNKNLEETT